MGNAEKRVNQEEGCYLLLPMKKDQTNWTKVYKQYPLAWEPGPTLVQG